MKIIIIGSGLSGLVSGAYLSKEGYEIEIFEQYPEIGGVTATIDKDGFYWDLGPLLLEGLAPHEKLGKILDELGIANQIKIIQEDRGQAFPDFEIWHPKEYEGPYWRREFLKKKFPNESEGLNKYYDFYDKMMEIGYLGNQLPFSIGFRSLFLRLKMFIKFLKVRKFKDWSASDVMDYYFNDPKLKAVFMGILADFVVKPSEFFGLGIPFFNVETAFEKRIPIEFKGGKYPVYHYIENGCGELVKALANMIRVNGGKINTNQKVVKIDIEENKAKGIRLESGESIDAKIIIASGGLFNIFFNLVGKEYLPIKFNQKIKNITLMESVFMVHLGIDFNPRKFQREALCYYYGTYDIENGVKKCREGDYHEGKDGFLIYIPSIHSPKMAPKDKHAVTIYTIAPHKLKAGDWEDQKDQFADRLISFAEKIIPGLSEGTETKLIMTPNDFKQRINVERHSFGGTAPIIGQENPNHKTPIENLWYIGAYSESGGGLMGVAAGAREVCKKIINEM